MITYSPAFDLYHAIYRMAHIVEKINDGERFEIDKVRIWDFYLLFPYKLHQISLKRTENDMRSLRSDKIKKDNNPYNYQGSNRKLLEWIKPFQLSALSCLVSCGILDREDYLSNRISIANRETLASFIQRAGDITATEQNALSFLSIFSRNMPLTGADGLKARTRLLESKYDAE